MSTTSSRPSLASRIRKTLVSVAADIGLVAAALTPASDGDSVITGTEWTAIGIAVVGTIFVFFVPNEDDVPTATTRSTPPPLD